jgi:uncharacterized membrane protein
LFADVTRVSEGFPRPRLAIVHPTGNEVPVMNRPPEAIQSDTSKAQDAARIALGLMLVAAGTSHLTVAREPFKAQVPSWVPLDPDTVVLQSGVAEIALGAALVALPSHKAALGGIAGTFFTCIFPGNIAQYRQRRNAFGLDTDGKRFARLFFQPLLVAWALWSTGAVSAARAKAQQRQANRRLLTVIEGGGVAGAKVPHPGFASVDAGSVTQVITPGSPEFAPGAGPSLPG